MQKTIRERYGIEVDDSRVSKITFTLTFDLTAEAADVPIDHSLLNAKMELLEYGYSVGKISMKEKTVVFKKG